MAMTKLALALTLAAAGVPNGVPAPGPSRVQLALLLDTSNSMDGLIDQARSQLWTVVNEFAAARKGGQSVVLEVALYEYGNTRLSPQQGYVRQVLPFTTDLDRLSEELFALTTSGGDEYCGTAIQAALDQLRWSTSPADLKAVFIAGNEPFSQGPVDFRRVSARAVSQGVLVNTIHCGTREFAAGERAGWREGAQRAYGVFGEFDQDKSVVQLSTPYDEEIARLSMELNRSYVPYGAQGSAGLARQQAQDDNAGQANIGAVMNRAFAKSKHVYTNSNWDLVDAVKNGQVDVRSVKTEDLPVELQKLSLDARKAVVAEKAEARARLQARIQELEQERRRFLSAARRGEAGVATLDTVMMDALREQAARRGFALQ
jgi:hypothetical protein